MTTVNSLKNKIQNLIDLSNHTTGQANTDLTTSVNALAEGYGQGETVEEYDGEIIVEGEPSSGGTGGDLTINGIIKEYQVNAGASVSAGDFVEFVTKWGSGEFSSGTVPSLYAGKLDEERVFVAYLVSQQICMNVIKFMQDTITVSTQTTYTPSTSSGTILLKATVLDDSTAVIVHGRISSTMNENVMEGKTNVVKITDMTISVGGSYSFVAYNVYNLRYVIRLNDTKFLIEWNAKTSGNYYVIVCTVSGSTVTKGSLKTIPQASLSLAALSSTTLLSIYSDSNNSSYRTARVFTIDGTSVASSGASALFPSSASIVTIVALSSTKAICLYKENDIVNCSILTISGTSVVAGEAIPITSTYSSYIQGVALSSNKVLLTYKGSSTFLTGKVLTINDTGIEEGEEVSINDLAITNNSIAVMSENHVIVACNADVGRYYDLKINGTTITVDEVLGEFVQPATSNKVPVGVAKTAGTEGETVQVYRAVE